MARKKGKGGGHTGKMRRGDKMHMKSKKGGDKMAHKGHSQGENLPSICDAACFSPGEHYQGGGGPNEKHG